MIDNNMAQYIQLYLHMKNISSYVMNEDDDSDDYQKYINHDYRYIYI